MSRGGRDHGDDGDAGRRARTRGVIPEPSDYRALIGSHESIAADSHVLVKYRIRAAEGIALDTIAIQCALDGSTVSWTPLRHHTPDHLASFSTKVRSIEQTDPLNGIVELAFPLANFGSDAGGIPLLFATVAGSIFRERSIASIGIADIEFPPGFIEQFPGPRHGVAGLRDRLNVHDRPLLIARIHDVGLAPAATAELARQIALGGADVIYTSPLVADTGYSPFIERVDAIMKALEAASRKTKRQVLYLPSLTVNSPALYDMVSAALERGAAGFETDMLTTGFSTIPIVREQLDAIIVFYPITHSLYTREPNGGVDLGVFLKLGRLVGADMTCISSVVGRFELAAPMDLLRFQSILAGDSLRIKPSLPVVIGGQHPGSVRKTIEMLGSDIGISAGTGILAHPGGPQAGAQAMRQSIDVSLQGREPHGRRFREYRQAIEKWGEE